jgi:hypothetical protein
VEALYFPVAKARHQVIIDHSYRLHECVTDRRTDEGETALLQIFAHGV